jgi:hypothetical protein
MANTWQTLPGNKTDEKRGKRPISLGKSAVPVRIQTSRRHGDAPVSAGHPADFWLRHNPEHVSVVARGITSPALLSILHITVSDFRRIRFSA